jgi:hypothetical protein
MLAVACEESWYNSLAIAKVRHREEKKEGAVDVTATHMLTALQALRQNFDAEHGTCVSSVIARNWEYYNQHGEFHPMDVGGDVMKRIAACLPRFQPPPASNNDCNQRIATVSFELAMANPEFSKQVVDQTRLQPTVATTSQSPA